MFEKKDKIKILKQSIETMQNNQDTIFKLKEENEGLKNIIDRLRTSIEEYTVGELYNYNECQIVNQIYFNRMKELEKENEKLKEKSRNFDKIDEMLNNYGLNTNNLESFIEIIDNFNQTLREKYKLNNYVELLEEYEKNCNIGIDDIITEYHINDLNNKNKIDKYKTYNYSIINSVYEKKNNNNNFPVKEKSSNNMISSCIKRPPKVTMNNAYYKRFFNELLLKDKKEYNNKPKISEISVFDSSISWDLYKSYIEKYYENYYDSYINLYENEIKNNHYDNQKSLLNKKKLKNKKEIPVENKNEKIKKDPLERCPIYLVNHIHF